jgi:putative ABC transport system permease protein
MLRQNLLYAFRTLGKNPGFAVVIVLTLALGIGSNTAIFSVVYSALLHGLPYQHPDKLLVLGESRQQYDEDIASAQSSYPDFLDWKRSAKSFASLAGYGGDGFTLDAKGEPKLTPAAQVTANFFSTLGVKPFLGRDFVASEEQPDGPHVAILSYAFWLSEFAGDRNIVGTSVRLDTKPVTIVGVLPRDFQFAPARSAPLWVPLHASGDLGARRSLRWFSVIARLAPGVSVDQAHLEMEGINAQLAREYPKENASTFMVIAPLRERIVGKIRPLLLVLLGAVGLVLLITCANVANLLLTRSIGRRKEFAVRSALGASRASLLSLLLTEGLLFSLCGAAVGLLGAQWGVSLLLAAIPDSQLRSMPYLRDAAINLPVLAFLCLVALVTGLLFGLAPGLVATRSSLNDVLKDESRSGTSSGHARLRNSLVVAEIAISLVLLVAGGLILQSLRALLHHSPGFDPHGVLTFNVYLPDASYPSEKAYPFDSPAAIHFEHEFSKRLRNSTGVLDVAATNVIPASGGSGSIRFLIEGRPTALGQEDEANIVTGTVAYFSTLRIPLLQGRFFTEDDSPVATRTVIVNRAFVQHYFPGEDPIGKRIRFTFNVKQPFRQIVGVVGDTALVNLDAPPPPVIYTPNDQDTTTYLSYMVRTAGDPAAFVNTARALLHDMDPQLPLIQPRTLEQIALQSPSVFLRRYPSYLIGSFAALALILAMVGLYGLLSHMVLQRTREIGIRVAMGAQRRDILRLVLRNTIVTAVLGVAIGIAAGQLLTRLMSTLLFGVTPSDAFTFAGVAALLLLVALLACAIPARRAMRVDPVIALRYE